ncbi:MAG TPA: hypothetical protein PKA88_05605 [Polyangiaceae bacterium]|nr:hypothetical protein [Polyangiaceae bacterium]HMR73514.1 hypothetical protein [Polyangiaceae bacterium]
MCGFIALSACGGAASSGPGSAAGPGAEGSATQGPGSEAAEESPATPESRCQDGSCFVCGEGLCPKGFFCDQKAAGGAACSWLPECAAQPTCACVSKVLADDCSCAEKSGGVFCE